MPDTRNLLLWSLFALQAVCALFFLSDVFGDLLGLPESQNAMGDTMEGVVTFALVLGTVFTGWELRNSMHREARMRQQIGVASGAFADILQKQFDAWALTEAEQAVALLGIKGYAIADIARMRDTKEGTIKAQNAAIYRKAGVTGRLQLLSHFVEDLMDDSLLAPTASGRGG